MGRYVATKTYEQSLGLSCAYRLWQSQDDDRFLHGYSLEIKMVFECVDLDASNRVLNPYTFQPIADWLRHTFSHTTCVAEDDPNLAKFQALNEAGVLVLRVVHGVGVARFAEIIWHRVFGWLRDNEEYPRVRIKTVEVRESGGTSAMYLE